MAAPTSDVEIVNLAFALLKQNEKVTSLESPVSKSETLAAQWYDITRRSVLCAYSWNFARFRAVLSLNSTAPAFGYANAYNLPSDYLAVVFLGDNYDEDYETEYAIEGNQILIDNDGAATLNLCYIRETISVPRFDPLFVDLFVHELALRLASGLVGLNINLKNILTEKADLEADARLKNGRDNPPKVRNVSPILARRRQGTSGSTFDGTHLLS